MTSVGIGVFPTLRDLFFLFLSRKAAKPQRNCGPLGKTSGGLCYLSRRIAGACHAELLGPSLLCELFFFLFFLLAKAPSRKEIVGHLSGLACPPRRILVSWLLLLGSRLFVLGTWYLVLRTTFLLDTFHKHPNHPKFLQLLGFQNDWGIGLNLRKKYFRTFSLNKFRLINN